MENKNIESFESLIRPDVLRKQIPSNDAVKDLVSKTREEIENIITGKSNKKLFIIGPCSIHNVDEALEYGMLLKNIAEKVKDRILVVMRVYFEKPRTTIGWKGLINDPSLDNTFNVNDGLKKARQLLVCLNRLGLPCGYEVLDTITPQYISDLISWGAIGARTTESQVHRQMVSGLSMPVGFKNGTSGNKTIARDAILSARFQHCFMGITDSGDPAICKTRGNEFCHTILRGGRNGPNYFEQDIIEMHKLLAEKALPVSIMVDCSHGNSNKDFKNQSKVLNNVLRRMVSGEPIMGVMIESNLVEGKQPLQKDLKYGVSITDSCIGISETNKLLEAAFSLLSSGSGSFKEG